MVLFQELTQVSVAAVLHYNALDLRRWVCRHSVEGDNKVIVMDSCQDLQLFRIESKNIKKVLLVNILLFEQHSDDTKQ